VNELTVKVTMYSLLPNSEAMLYVKENDDNIKIHQLTTLQPFDKITCFDNDAKQTVFRDCKIVNFETDMKDGDFKVHQLRITYGSIDAQQ